MWHTRCHDGWGRSLSFFQYNCNLINTFMTLEETSMGDLGSGGGFHYAKIQVSWVSKLKHARTHATAQQWVGDKGDDQQLHAPLDLFSLSLFFYFLLHRHIFFNSPFLSWVGRYLYTINKSFNCLSSLSIGYPKSCQSSTTPNPIKEIRK